MGKIVPEGNISNSGTYSWARGEAEGLINESRDDFTHNSIICVFSRNIFIRLDAVYTLIIIKILDKNLIIAKCVELKALSDNLQTPLIIE